MKKIFLMSIMPVMFTMFLTSCSVVSSTVSKASTINEICDITVDIFDASGSNRHDNAVNRFLANVENNIAYALDAGKKSKPFLHITILAGSTQAESRSYFLSGFIDEPSELFRDDVLSENVEIEMQAFISFVKNNIPTIDGSITDINSIFDIIKNLSQNYPDQKICIDIHTDGITTQILNSTIPEINNFNLKITFIGVGQTKDSRQPPQSFIQSLQKELILKCSIAKITCQFNNLVHGKQYLVVLLQIFEPGWENAIFTPEIISLPADILFEKDKCDLLSAGKNELQKIADQLKNITKTITITGHSDNLGSPTSRQPLSQCRANVVKEYLVFLGVTTPIKAIGVGDTRPTLNIDPNTILGQARNRKVLIIY